MANLTNPALSAASTSNPQASLTGSGLGRTREYVYLIAILFAFAATIAALRPAPNFGSLQDDAMYFASAKALSVGQGYLLPSFPGGLTTLKYPVLYPWVLSWIWHAYPQFPTNVVPAIALTVLFGCWFLAACWLVGKRIFGLRPAWALILTALCAFNFFTLLLGGSVLSDLPFGALALSAVLAAERSFEPDGHWGWMAVAGVLAGLATGLRTVGMTIVAGIVLAAVLRRDWRRAALICLVGGGLSLPWVLPPILHQLQPQTHMAATLPVGWTQTLAFYASYVGQWRHFVPNWGTQRAVLLKNLFSVALGPGIFLLYPLASRSAVFSMLGGIVALAAWSGIALRFRRIGWKTIDASFIFYLAMVLPWPFPPQRFLVPFVPLLFGGLVFIFRELVVHLAKTLRSSPDIGSRVGAMALGVLLLALAVVAGVNSGYFAPKQLAKATANQRSLLVKERQVYRWIGAHTHPGAVFIAYDDVLVYLYTGRQAIRPIACSTAAGYDNDPSYARRDASHLGDVAEHVSAGYWLVTPTDFDKEVGDDGVILSGAEKKFLARFPVVFQTDSGRVHLYALPYARSSAPGRRLR